LQEAVEATYDLPYKKIAAGQLLYRQQKTNCPLEQFVQYSYFSRAVNSI
jgi:hypothetical protein